MLRNGRTENVNKKLRGNMEKVTNGVFCLLKLKNVDLVNVACFRDCVVFLC